MEQLFRRILRRVGDKPAQLAFRISDMPVVRRRLARRYARSLAAYRAKRPAVDGLDAQIVAGLEQNGIFVTSLEALGIAGSREMLRAAGTVASECSATALAESRAGRVFIYAPPSATVEHPELFDWGLDERLLDIAEAYIGQPAAYDGMTLIYTVADGTAHGPRQWHRDREDRRMIKLAVYCTDVTEQGGPFELISRVDPSQGVDDHYEYEFGTPEVLARRLGPDYAAATVSCTGPAGTVVFADTARYFHRGAPAFDKDRAALYYGYFARSTRHPFFCERSGLSRRQIAGLVQSMSPRRRASALWQASLPFWLKLIPPAPV